jgi:hypothetical protein
MFFDPKNEPIVEVLKRELMRYATSKMIEPNTTGFFGKEKVPFRIKTMI